MTSPSYPSGVPAATSRRIDADAAGQPQPADRKSTSYTHEIAEYRVTISGLHWTRDGLNARITVQDRQPVESRIRTYHEGDIGLSGLRDKEALSRHLGRATEMGDGEWARELSDLFAVVLHDEQKRGALISLADIEATADDPVLDAGGFPVLASHPTILFGDGESYKSMIALWAAGVLADQGHRVLYLDWELNPEDHRARLETLFGRHDVPDVHYLRCAMPIRDMVSRIRQECERAEIDFIIVDSVAFACGMAAETSEAAMTYFAALRDIGVAGSLSIAHDTKHTTKGDRGKEKPFGSAFWHNGARLTWRATATRSSSGNAAVRLDCRKSNLIDRPSPRKIDICRRGPRTEISCRVDDPSAAIKRGEIGLVRTPTLRETIEAMEADADRRLSNDELREMFCENGAAAERVKWNSLRKALKRMRRLGDELDQEAA